MNAVQAENPVLNNNGTDTKKKSASGGAFRMERDPFSIGWYMGLFKSNWVLTVQMVLASVLIQLFALGMPIFYIVIFDRVFGRQNLATLDIIGIGILIMLVFDLLVKMLRTYLMSHQLEWLDKLTTRYYLDKLFATELSRVEDSSSPPLSEQFSNLVKMNQTVLYTLLVSVLDTIFSVVLVIILLFLNPVLATVSMLPLIPITMLAIWNTPRAKKRALAFHQEQRQCQYQLAEVLRSGETLKSLNATEFKKASVMDKFNSFIHGSFATHLDQIGQGNIQGFFINMGSMLTLYVGAHIVLSGGVSYGIYLAVNMLSRTVLGSVQKLVGSLIQLEDMMGSSEQLKRFFTEVEKSSLASVSEPMVLETVKGEIKATDVSFTYEENLPLVLNQCSFTIKPGERVVITGKSGAGKTTLIRLLQRLYEPSKGYITLDSFNMADVDIENLRHHMGVALQKPAIFLGTIGENIALGRPDATAKEITEAAQLAELNDAIFESPNGLDTKVNHFGLNLSGGQIGRIAIARLFLTQPSVIILDEALASVPPSMKVSILNNIHKTFREATCIFVSNFVPLHQGVDRILVMDEGRIVEEGAFKELVDKKGEYFSLYHPGGVSR